MTPVQAVITGIRNCPDMKETVRRSYESAFRRAVKEGRVNSDESAFKVCPCFNHAFAWNAQLEGAEYWSKGHELLGSCGSYLPQEFKGNGDTFFFSSLSISPTSKKRIRASVLGKISFI